MPPSSKVDLCCGVAMGVGRDSNVPIRSVNLATESIICFNIANVSGCIGSLLWDLLGLLDLDMIKKTHKTSKLIELDKTENSHKCLLSLSHSSCVDHKLFDAIDLDGLKLLLRSMP